MRETREIDGLVVAVTGGAQGIGRAVADRLVAAGARVAIGDLDTAPAGPDRLALPLDVTDEESFAGFLAEVENQLGPIDVLVNNAGVMWVGPFQDEPPAAVRRQLAVNVEGVIRGTRLAVARMSPRGRGHIVTIASVASWFAPPGEATYAATKHAVLGYLTAVRAELRGRGIDLSMVMPGVVDTELAADTGTGPVRRLRPEDVAAAVESAVRRPRFQIVLPGHVTLLHKVVTVLPGRLRDLVFRVALPDQAGAARGSARRDDYQRRHFS
jgi:NAD(P)-dependent dehydrogenase (short-subunit alcohol dehydrogenase family)